MNKTLQQISDNQQKISPENADVPTFQEENQEQLDELLQELQEQGFHVHKQHYPNISKECVIKTMLKREEVVLQANKCLDIGLQAVQELCMKLQKHFCEQCTLLEGTHKEQLISQELLQPIQKAEE